MSQAGKFVTNTHSEGHICGEANISSCAPSTRYSGVADSPVSPSDGSHCNSLLGDSAADQF